MQLNRQNQQPKIRAHHPRSLGQFLTELLDSYQTLLERKNISLVKDFDDVVAPFDVTLVSSAIRALVDNAIQSMPLGGELSAILIDGKHQWELEIADTVWPSKNSVARQAPAEDSHRPVILPFPENEYLRVAHRAAITHGGEVQTWKCPLGGTAHVLAIPKQKF
jgi:hypothetical protein